jgi:hypothetical protein
MLLPLIKHLANMRTKNLEKQIDDECRTNVMNMRMMITHSKSKIVKKW